MSDGLMVFIVEKSDKTQTLSIWILRHKVVIVYSIRLACVLIVFCV